METKSKLLIGLGILVSGAAGYYFLIYKKKEQTVIPPQTPIDIITAGVNSGTGFYQGSEYISAEDFKHLMNTFGRSFADQAAIYVSRGSISTYGGVQGLGAMAIPTQDFSSSASGAVVQSPEQATLLLQRMRALKR